MLYRSVASRSSVATARLTALSYARWCATAASNPTPSRDSMDPKVIIAKARALTSPCEAYPATSCTPTGPTDPRIHWREHWDATSKAPYYENCATFEVTNEIPEGLPTRFGGYWVGKGFNVLDDLVQPKDGSSPASGALFTVGVPKKGKTPAKVVKTQMRQFSMSAPSLGIKAAPEGTDPSKMTMKQRIALYGSAGMVLYLIIHNILLACIFVALYVFKIDLVTVARSYGYELKFLPGGKKEMKAADGTVAVSEQDTEEVAHDPSLLATFITAVALCKMVVPFQLTLTLILAPTVAPKLNVFIQRVRARWGYVPPVPPKPYN